MTNECEVSNYKAICIFNRLSQAENATELKKITDLHAIEEKSFVLY